MEFKKLIDGLDSGKISPYQIYNLDMNYPQIFGVEHYTKNPNDNIDTNQKLHKLFLDIEVISDDSSLFEFDKMETGRFPISCITIYSSFKKIYHCYMLLNKNCIEAWNMRSDHVEYFKQQLIDNEYLVNGEFDIKVKTYTNDLPLIKECWEKIHELDPVVITGWNSDNFDLVYIYYRLNCIYNKDEASVSKILSKFGDVKMDGWGNGRGKVKLVEYVNADLCYLFKPRDDQGLNFGKKLPSYSLDFVSDTILEKKKFNYKDQNLTLDQFFVRDPINYLLYNVIDVVLCVLLDDKLKLIDQVNTYRRLMSTTFSESLRGSTALFDTLVLKTLSDKDEFVRFGLSDETIITINKSEVEKIPKPMTTKNLKWSVNEINQRDFLKITRKFEGAFVQSSPGQIFDQNNGLLVDLDASALYPSNIRQNNISFDTYFGRILDPYTTSNTITLLDSFLKDKTNPKIKLVYSQFLELSIKYNEGGKITPLNKGDSTQQYFYVISHLYQKIINSKATSIKEIFQPKDFYFYILLKKYMIPFLNLVDELSPHNTYIELNQFCYDYLLNNEFKHKTINIIENINSPSIRIVQVLAETLESYLKKNDLILTLTGCMFNTHQKKLSLFTDWLSKMTDLRKQYKNERNKHDPNSDEYTFYDARQLSIKIAMNSSYGIFGQSTFRYSNNWLAKTITGQGRLTLKISQQIAESYLQERVC